MRWNTISSPHLSTQSNVSVIMRRVLYALIPGILIYFHFFGWGVLVNICIASLAAVVSEALMLLVRRRPLRIFLSDYSAIVTAVLLALALPPLAPWWLTTLATAFAIIIAKQLYGGLGYNPFNPAMVGYVVVLISYPQQLTRWLLPAGGLDFLQTLQIQLFGKSGTMLDSITGATPIDAIKTGLTLDKTVTEISASPVFGMLGGSGWEWIAIGFLIGGLWLLYLGIIRWQIPAAVLLSIFVMATPFYLLHPEQYATPWFHWFSGGTMLAAFFIATDPVSASTTDKGRLIYGAGIGIFTYIIRTWGGYPDGIAFAVLLMNTAVPTIDYYTKPRVFGARKQ